MSMAGLWPTDSDRNHVFTIDYQTIPSLAERAKLLAKHPNGAKRFLLNCPIAYSQIVSEMPTPDRSTAAAFPRYLTGEVVADSVALQWPGLYARRWRLPRAVDRFLVPANPETHISCNLRRVELHETRVAAHGTSR